MTMSDPLGDMLTRIRNGQRAHKSAIESPASRLRSNVLEVLEREGFIRGYSQSEMKPGISELRIELKYHEGAPVIREIHRVSKPGRRVYVSHAEIPKVRNGLGVAVLSTSKGVVSDQSAREATVGGEVLCEVW